MALIEWKGSFSVNVAEIDKEHQRLIELINELYDAMNRGEGRAVLGDVLDGLMQYAQTHFKTEERYFEQFGYPMAYEHCKEHSEFIQKVATLREDFRQEKVGVSIEVMNFLWDWLRKHIQQSDKSYSALFNARGLR